MFKRVCDICGRTITNDIAVVKDDRELYSKCSPHTIGITCPRDFDWDLCPSCKEKLYSWVQEQRAAAKESMKSCCHEEAVIESAPQAIQRIRDRILEAKRRLREM